MGGGGGPGGGKEADYQHHTTASPLSFSRGKENETLRLVTVYFLCFSNYFGVNVCWVFMMCLCCVRVGVKLIPCVFVSLFVFCIIDSLISLIFYTYFDLSLIICVLAKIIIIMN